MFGKKQSRHPVFRHRRRNPRRFPVVWIIVGLIFLAFWLVPVYGSPLDYFAGRTPSFADVHAASHLPSTPRPTPEHGGRIVFTCTHADFNQLCLVNADGTGYQQLSARPVRQ